jgi:lipopolysaccharide biosynthesis glycosyltransferase
MSLIQTNKNCIAVIVAENFLTQLFVTVLQLSSFINEKTDIVIICNKHYFTEHQLNFLLSIHKNIKLRFIDNKRFEGLAFGSKWRDWQYNCGYRFEIFSLVEYDKVFYLDLDTLIKGNILDVFNIDADLGFCKNYDGTIPEFSNFKAFNAGVCLIGKKYLNYDITDELVKISRNKKYSSDEAVLFALFGNKYSILPQTYNTLTTFVKTEEVFNSAKIVHYIGIKKPWNGKVFDCFDEYVVKHIGLSNCYYLYRKYKQYERHNTGKIHNHANSKLILG